MAEYFSLRDVVDDLRQAVNHYRSEAELARAIGVSRSFLNRVMRGEKKPTGKILKWLGYREAHVYEAT